MAAALVAPSQATVLPSLKPVNDSQFTFVSNSTCAFAARLTWALHELSAADKVYTVFVDLGETRPDWLAMFNPSKEIPLLIDPAGQCIPGNSAVLVEAASIAFHGSCDLRPANPRDYAAARAVIQAFDTRVVGTLYQLFRTKGSPAQLSQAVKLMETRLQQIEEMYSRTSEGPFLCGSELSFCDVGVLSVLHLFSVVLPAFRQYDDLLDESRVPRLAAAMQACKQRPAFTTAMPTAKRLLEHYTNDPMYNPDNDCAHLDAWCSRMVAADTLAP